MRVHQMGERESDLEFFRPDLHVAFVGGKDLRIAQHAAESLGHLLFDRLLRGEAVLIDEAGLERFQHRRHVRGHPASFYGKTEHAFPRAGDGGKEPVFLFAENGKQRNVAAGTLTVHRVADARQLGFQFGAGLAVEGFPGFGKHGQDASGFPGVLEHEIKLPRGGIQRHHAYGHELLRLREGTKADGGEIVGAFHGAVNAE